ncbi:Fatty acid synthase [Sarcoptes scabiei]|uniref:Fatty acid synthase n=1 Tax=Sarcoptes scabiei TaxID=52283 RepID=A0A834VAB9_SARSC|nr:Fatty acid synthase [Sarcoptes scabiei]
MAHTIAQDCPVKEDVVISGISGRFPESDTMDEFAKKLFSGEDMVTRDDRRWPVEINDGLGSRTGKIKTLEKFDSSFFSMLTYLSHSMDPISRIVLETTYEAFHDAGICPHQIRGSNTGVYFGINTIAQADGLPQDDFNDIFTKEAAFWVYGNSKVLYANRISFLFDFQGPSLVIDTACSASLVALATAMNDIRMGVCDTAVVATGNLVPAPFGNSIYSCVWDKRADGFVRSETIGTLILQRRSQAKRIYATVLHSKVNSDGFKSVGLFAPYWLRQKDLMVQTYEEAGVDPNELVYFEAHGTGTNVGDPQEAKAIAEAYCRHREKPLLVGAVKSNLGHSEGSSGLNSVAKVIIAFENKCIPANLHFHEPKAEIYAIVNKQIEPVTKNTRFENGIVGVNSFGVGGVNAHVLLKSNEKELTPESYEICKPIPRLVTVAGRTEEGINMMFDFIKNNPDKVHRDFLALLNESMKTGWVESSSNFPYRGYMIIKEQPNSTEFNTIKAEFGDLKVPVYSYDCKITDTGMEYPVWLVFSGMGSQWLTMANSMMKLEPFARSIQRSAAVLKPLGIDLIELLSKNDPDLWKSTVNPFVAITSMQVALYDVIKLLNLKIEGIIGHSFGEVACAYADGCLTLEQAIMTSYWRGKIVEQSKLPKGVLAAIGLSWEEAKKRCPPGIVPACHNGSDSVTISGLYEETKKFVEKLTSENVFARLVAGGEYPYHSPHMNAVAADLIKALKTVIPEPKKRSSKWISTSFDKSNWFTEKACYASAEYFTNNLVSPVLFNEGMNEISKDAIAIEVAPHSLFDSIFKRCYQRHHYIGLMKRNEPDNLNFFLSALGKIYTFGMNLDIENLYPRIEWPVARSTQSLSSLLYWDHSKNFYVKKYPEFHNFSTASDFYVKISVHETDWHFLRDHAIEGKALFPATGYLYLVWRRVANLIGQPWNKTPVRFENVRFLRPTLVSESSDIKFTIRLLQGNGEFIVFESNNVVCTGRAFVMENEDGLEIQDSIDVAVEEDRKQRDSSEFDYLVTREIYKELRIRGYDYGPKFQGLVEARSDGCIGKVKWDGHFISFMDCVLHISLVALPLRALFVPVGFDSVRIDPKVLFGEIERVKQEKKEKEEEEFHLKREFLYFSDKTKENETIEDHMTQRVESMVNKEEMEENAESRADLPIQFYETAFMKNEENKISLIPVVFDSNNRSIVIKGLEVKGMIPFPVPRKIDQKGLILEKYSHIPYLEKEPSKLPDDKHTELIEYIDMCNQLSSLLVFDKNRKPEQKDLQLPEKIYDLVKHYTKYCEIHENNHYRVFNLLRELLEIKVDKSNEGVEKLVYENCVNEEKMNSDGLINQELISKYDLSGDIIALLQTNERLVRPLVDTILENAADKNNLKVIEVNPALYLYAARIVQLIKTSYVGNLNIDYTYANTGTQVVTKDLDSLNMKSIEWNQSTNSFISDINTTDLILYRLTDAVIESWKIDRQLEAFYDALKENGFLLVLARNEVNKVEQTLYKYLNNDPRKETVAPNLIQEFIKAAKASSFGLVGMKSTVYGCTALLFRKLKMVYDPAEFNVLKITNFDYAAWLDKLKAIFAQNKDDPKPLWLIAKDQFNGVVGMVNCLRLEPGGSQVRCILDLDNSLSEEVDFEKSPFNEIGYLDLVFNVYKKGQWGSFRFITLPEQNETVETQYAYLDIASRGDLSSFRWYESDHKHFDKIAKEDRIKDMVMCDVYCSSLNFKDVMLATGRIQPGPESAIFDCVIGLEFSGRRRDNGKRVMGMVPFKGFATTITSFEDFLWEVPEDWSLEEAASIPVVYTTAFYSLIVRGQLQEGDKVLIHSAAGGVGQAAIRICQDYKCEVFVTVGNAEKRAFLKSEFGIPDENIFNSRDLSFERLIKERTKGNGVDIVLNSLAEDKLQASLRCLGLNGRFLEIGKYDMQMNKPIGLFAFLQNISFHGVCLDSYFREGFESPNLKRFMKRMTDLLYDGIKRGVVKPIQRTSYKWNEVEEAFRYMSTGKHIGKVIIKMREEEPQKTIVAKPLTVIANRRTSFNPSKSYVIVGGLGGFGLEMLYWMVMRGAKKFVLSSRNGLKNSYQKLYFKRLKELSKFISIFDIDVTISTQNVIQEDGAHALVDEAIKKGPVGGIFNLALVLHDAFVENQSVDTFIEVCSPKSTGLLNLDKVARAKCPEIEYFVCFSSLTAGRGNAGQINYGFANSAMERICETRRQDGLPGTAIQWGPIGDVGVVAEHLLVEEDKKEDLMKLFGGISLQRISSCLEVLDRLLQIDAPVLSSLIKSNLEDSKNQSEDDILDQLCAHLNVDKRSREETIGDAGLDSMTVVEIQQRLERDYEVSLTVADVKRITIGEIKDFRDGKRDGLKMFAEDIKKTRMHLANIKFEIPSEPYTIVCPNPEISKSKPIFFLPPIEGIYESLKEIIAEMAKLRPVITLNWMRKMSELNNIKKVAEYFKGVLAKLEPKGDHEIIGHSFGAIVGIHMCRKIVPIKTMIVLDPMDVSNFKEEFDRNEKVEMVLSYLRNFMSERLVDKVRKEALSVKNEQECIQRIADVLKSHGGKAINSKDIDDIIKDSFYRAEMVLKYQQKNIRKLRMFGRDFTQKTVQKMMKKITVNVTVIKRMAQESDVEKLNQILLTSYGIARQDFVGRFDVYQVIGNEEEYLTTHLHYISKMIKFKLGLIAEDEVNNNP